MRRYSSLLLADVKNIRRDPMLILATMGPVVMAVVFRFVVPILSDWLEQSMHFRLSDYYELILVIILQLVPLMLGMIVGYVMLDERDEQLIQLFAVTPLRKSGYLWIRLIVPMVITLFFTVFLIYFVDLMPVDWRTLLLFLPFQLLLTPIFALLLVGFAANKVEGLAFTKGAGILVLVPLIAYFVKWPWQLMVGIFPTYWSSKVFFVEGQGGGTWFFWGMGILVHLVLFWYCYVKFEERVD
ncbi:hypothetical protein [Thermoflavimicrobium daqui]|jgi:fluoroquinolone transport system permease protein|uniref:Uncharacterized protein n=1 Tax=Thermoflavimicrobium daqui TaxID=2137476 RepID=A0A364K2N5_9BACL|nr:hypothetical protein [Thermoflavimicrobium daqui]RAL22601.1 hypothetical protein DL897_14425 [Thermoflavimicrobium daqui]